MLNDLRKLHDLLTPRHRIRALALLGLMLFVGMMQVGAVTSIMPFMAVASDPDLIETNRWAAWVYEGLDFESRTSFLYFLGWVVFGMIVVTNLALAGSIWMGSRFVWSVNAALSRDLLEKYLARPYLWFVQHGSADPGKNVLSEVNQFTSHFMMPALELIRNAVTAILLVLLIVLVDWKVALMAAIAIGGAYAGIYFFLRRGLDRIGTKRVKVNKARFQAVQEAFGAFKELKAMQRERYFLGAYDRPTRRFSRYMSLMHILKALPKHVLEIIAFGGMVLLVLYFLTTHGDIRQVVPVLSVYAFAGYRLMPAMQRCFAALASIRFSHHIINVLHSDYFWEPRNEDKKVAAGLLKLPPVPGRSNRLVFRKEIRFDKVSFSYPESDRPALYEVSMTIPHGQLVAFCGVTGSGKTTLVDLLLGLFRPDDGRITVDGVALDDETIPLWKPNVGYVPQQIFLSDDTIARNIAFGLPDKEMDMAAVEEAARIAQIHDFITGQLSQGYRTVVGERGVRLSGGQRQRLGIARAVYHQPEVLVFDEATSALDGGTEDSVIRAIQAMAGTRTVIMVAHRLSTVKECQQILFLSEGAVNGCGRYEDLIASNEKFLQMAGSYAGEAR